MSHPLRFRGALVALVAAGLGAFALEQVQAERATSQSLGGADRYLTALSTDKPIYRPGERVWVRGVVLNAFSRKPLAEGANPTIEIKGPKGDTVASGSTATQDGVWGFSWQIPGEQAGGSYTLRAMYPWNGHAPAERKFDVRVFRAPRLKSQIVFLRDGYGPGDKVTATLDVKRAEGGVPAGAKVTATARVDGEEVARVPATVDPKGVCMVSFNLPKAIARGEGSLGFAIEDGGVVETAAKTIPILLQTLDLSLFPEGGELVAGVSSRVYFEARTPAQKPADIAGAVVDEKGREVARFRSEHEGRGRFELLPVRGARYKLRVDEPGGIKTTWPLPEVGGPDRVKLQARDEVTAPGAPVKLLLASARAQKVKVTLSQREVELAAVTVDLQAGAPAREVSLSPRDADGVLVVTAWSDGRPLAERLVYRKPQKTLTIELRTDKKQYVPGDTVKLTARATRNGKPASALIGLTVADDAVLEMIEKREQAPRLPVMVFLEPEVLDLADGHVYLDEKNPKSARALDLLLGTQGWRRFAVMSVAQLIEKHGDQGRRALALRIQSRVEMAKGAALENDVAVLRMAAPGGPPARGVLRGARPEAAVQAVPAMAPPMPAAPPVAAPAPVVAAEPPAAMRAQSVAAPRADLEEAIAKKELADEDRAIGGAAGGRLAKRAMAPRPMQPHNFVVVREYAHALRPARKPTDRVDFTETLYWNAAARTNEKTGEVTVSFALNDSVTSFKAFADGFTADGALGAGATEIESVQPFYVEPKLPLEVTAGDVIRLPVSLVNGTGGDLRGATVSVTAPRELRLGQIPRLDLRGHERARRILEIGVGHLGGPAEITLAAKAGPYADNVSRKLAVKPNGFPFQVAFSGLTVKDGTVSHTITIPANVVPSSVHTNVAVYPTPLANMTEALARLIRDPHGCFEQTSSTTYPLTMAQQYFTSHTGVDPKLVAAAQEKLDAGYKRLVGFECSDKGYEWFGENPGHEALTAYGLLHFADMASVREVDAAMMVRSRDWLLKQRDGKGGFARKRRSLHTWIEDQDTSNGYILWALLESGGKNARDALAREITGLKEALAKNTNSYALALGANVLALAGEKGEAKKVMEKLAGRQNKTGQVDGATNSIVGSGGEALVIEATSLAVLAWLRDPAFAGNVERSMKYLADNCEDGRYGSTQSTVLALRAIVTYDKSRARPKAPGSVRVFVDGQPVGDAVKFDAQTQGAIKLPDITARLGHGSHKIEVKMQGGSPMPYAVGVDYSALTPVSSPACPLLLDVKLGKSTLEEGQLVEADVTVRNLSKAALPTAVAIVGLPGGLEPRHDQLKELVKRGTIDAYEVMGREVVLYWRGMQAAKQVTVSLSLLAAVPGSYTGPASRAYLYYTDEHKIWVGGLKATITPKG